tara:strand:+ start:103 stop:1533 length:1431 start_codon:yes stop_codon:yes gene_type:complete
MSKKKESSLKSMIWSILGRYLPNLIQIVSTIVIARLVTPQEFGEVALITVFIQIASLLIASGFSEALIYRVKNSNALYSSVFYLNILLSILLYGFLCLASNNIATFYEINRLEILSKVVGVNIILYSFTYIQRVFYMIDGNFKTPAIVVLISAFIGSMAGIFLAYNGYGVWALVYQTLLINLIQLILFWKLSSWKPDFVFSIKELKLILPYSTKILLNNMVQVFYDNAYTLVIGKMFSSKILGFYNRMQTLVFFTTTNFMYAIETVFYPLLCKKKEDTIHLKESYELLIRISTFIAFPILVILISLGKPIIIILLTEKWLGSLQILKLISIAYLFVPIIYINNSFLKIINKPNVLFQSGLLKKVIGLLILIISINYDIEYVMYGIIFYSFIDSFISMIITQISLRISVTKQLSFILNNILLNIILLLTLNYTSSFFNNVFVKLFVSIVIGIFFYLVIPMTLKLKEFIILKNIFYKK